MTTIYVPGQPLIAGQFYQFSAELVSQADPTIFQVNPTLAVGDVKISIDGGSKSNLLPLPVAVDADDEIKVTLVPAVSMGATKYIQIHFKDQIGSEWYSVVYTIPVYIEANPTVFPAGAVEYTFTVTDSATTLPIDGAEVWFATDALYANVVWKGETDAFGIARDVNNDKPMLDAGTYYFRTQHANYGASEGSVVVS